MTLTPVYIVVYVDSNKNKQLLHGLGSKEDAENVLNAYITNNTRTNPAGSFYMIETVYCKME